MKRLHLALFFCLISLSAFAGPLEEQAKTLREQAIIFAKADNCKEAIKLFQRAYDTSKEAKDLYNIGTCQLNLTKYAAALETYEAYISQLALDDDQLRLNTEQLKNLSSKLQRAELQNTNKTKTKALLELTASLSQKAAGLPDVTTTTTPKDPVAPVSQPIAPTPSPEAPLNPSTTAETPPKKSLALPLGLVGLATVAIAGELALEAKTQRTNETTKAREALRVGLLAGAGLSLVGAGAALVLRSKKKPELSAKVSISMQQVALFVSF